MKSLKKDILFILIIVFFSGCQFEEKQIVGNEKRLEIDVDISKEILVRSFLEKVFTTREEDIKKLEWLVEDISEGAYNDEDIIQEIQIVQPASFDGYNQYLYNEYSEYLTQEAFDSFVANRFLDAAAWAYVESGLRINPIHIDVIYDEGKNGYEYEVIYKIVSEDNSEDESITNGILVVEDKIVSGRIESIKNKMIIKSTP